MPEREQEPEPARVLVQEQAQGQGRRHQAREPVLGLGQVREPEQPQELVPVRVILALESEPALWLA